MHGAVHHSQLQRVTVALKQRFLDVPTSLQSGMHMVPILWCVREGERLWLIRQVGLQAGT